MRRFVALVELLALLPLCHCLSAGTEAVALNDHTRLGQRLTAATPWDGIWLSAPSWLDSEGGFTVSVWESPKRTTLLAQKTFIDFPDNSRLEVWLPATAAPGVIYWEIHDRVGKTKVGLWSQVDDQEKADCAYIDGVPEPKRAFTSGINGNAGRKFEGISEVLAALRSDAPVTDKVAACRELALLGDEKTVPLLASFLGDPRLSHPARYALEAMPSPAAGAALRQALKQVHGEQRIGVINSLGVRRDTAAIPELQALLADPDPNVASAAAVCLGRVGTPDTARILLEALRTGSSSRPAVIEGALECTHHLLKQGTLPDARPLLAALATPEMPESVREAAWRGTVLAQGDDGPATLLTFLRSQDAAQVRAALWLVSRGLPGQEITKAIAAALDRLPEPLQVSLVRNLADRGDPAAVASLAKALGEAPTAVRQTIPNALLRLGTEGAVTALVDAVASPDPALGEAVRTALLNLREPTVDPTLESHLDSADKAFRVACIQLLGQRRVSSALPRLMKAVSSADQDERAAALVAVRELAGVAEIPALLAALVEATGAKDRKLAEETLGAVSHRAGPGAARPLLEALVKAPAADKAPILKSLARTGTPEALAEAVKQLTATDGQLAEAALQVVTNCPTRDAVPHLFALAQGGSDERIQVLAVRGLLRLAGPQKGAYDADLSLLSRVMPLCKRADEKRAALAVVGKVVTPQSLGIATRALTDPEVAAEACSAVLEIAEKLPRPGDTDVAAAMEAVLSAKPDDALRRRAEALLAKQREYEDAVAKKLEGKIPDAAPAKPLRPRRLLLFDVNVGYGGHPSRFAANEAFALMGKTTGAYETVVSRDPEVFRPESLKRFDAVCFNNTVGLPFEDPDLQRSLVQFVYGGGGLLGIHGTTFAFTDWGGKRGDTWPEFGRMLGARGGSHGDAREEVIIRIDDPTHPVNAVFGGKSFEYGDEYFRVTEPYSRDRVRVLLSIDTQKTDLASHKLPDELKSKDGDYALAWVRNYGRGRVCYSTIGHNASVFEDKVMLTFYLAAIQFVLGDLPGPTLPSNRLTPATRAWEKLGWRLGMTTYSLHKYTFFEAMEKTRELGLPYINGLCFQKVSKDIPKDFGPDLSDDELAQIRLKLDDTHTQLLTHYIGTIPGDEDGCRKVFEFARKMGIETLIAEPKVADLDIIERFCDEYDINLGIHNHGPDQSPNYWHPDKIMAACKGRSRRVGACVDVGYWLRAGIDPIEGMKTLGSRLITIQMHDLNEITPEGHDVPWGTGAGRSRELIQTLHELGLKPTMFGLEYSYDWFDNMPEMAECAAFFDKVAVELAK